MNALLRVVLVEDHATVREGLRLLIDHQPDMTVVAEASNGNDAVRLAQRDDIDLVIMDLSMPGSSGLLAARALRDSRPALKIVVLTRHADQAYLQELLRAGVSGYVLKQSPHANCCRRSVRRPPAGSIRLRAHSTLGSTLLGSSFRSVRRARRPPLNAKGGASVKRTGVQQ